jgi:hypothetical protein
MSTTSRVVGRSLSFAIVAMTMTACLKLDMRIDLSSNDTASGTMTFALDKELVRLTGGSFDQLTGGETPLPSGVDVSSSDYEDDTFVGKTYTFHDVPIEQMSDSTDAESLQIRRQGDTYVVSGVLDLTTDALEGGAGGQLGQAALQSAEVRVAITFPGPVQSATGQIDGRTVTWMPKVGERTVLSAVGSAIGSDGVGAAVWIVIALLVAAAVVAGAVLVTRRNRRGSQAPMGSGWGGSGSTPIAPTATPAGPISGEPPASAPGGVPSPPASAGPVPLTGAPDQPVGGPIPEQPVEPHRPVAPQAPDATTPGERPDEPEHT